MDELRRLTPRDDVFERDVLDEEECPAPSCSARRSTVASMLSTTYA
jgi:hypothetical protein